MNKIKILSIEDDSMIQDLIKEFLSSQGYIVECATNGEDGINMIKQNDYNLILLDVMMPKLDGFSTCKIIRNISNVPIIFITALGDETSEIKGFDLNCDDYISKPFSFNILVKRVQAVLDRAYKINKDIISFESLQLNLDTFKAIVNENEIELTATEFNILKYLITNYPSVITRESLLNNVWGYDYYVDDRVVDAHIKNIRKKLNISYIKTVKGIGYTLEKNIKKNK